MKSLSSLGIGLSLVFGCLLLALIAELYYLLWWKKRMTNRDIEDDYSSSARELFYLLCWKKPSSLSSAGLNPHSSVRLSDSNALNDSEEQLHQLQYSHSGMDFLFKPFGEDDVETEVMRLHHLSGTGPPRFLFTIKEETKEDLESEDGKSRGDNKSRKGSRSRSLSDLLLTMQQETPYLTPLSSPPFFTPPLTPSLDRYSHQGVNNPLFDSSSECDNVRWVRSSPPPTFKFLKDAEEKLYKKTVKEGSVIKKSQSQLLPSSSPSPPPQAPPPPPSHAALSNSSMGSDEEEEGSFITIMVGKNKEKEQQHQYYSSSSQEVDDGLGSSVALQWMECLKWMRLAKVVKPQQGLLEVVKPLAARGMLAVTFQRSCHSRGGDQGRGVKERKRGREGGKGGRRKCS
ncbi:hypothetical protein H6P81_016267 [Aristolochia fimbriata]|uniref:Uncharacterized protein n=1 Tax=Aristolochia fimbriata TaxID=158543 RepID=A0AAV7EBL5_ARIFI|nr:hypothetical protein H6P81_016267 [Aristolochia fimbriata]